MIAAGTVSQYRRRVHLLLWQIEIARAHVLVRIELDLLEADHTRHDVDFSMAAAGTYAVGIRGLGSGIRKSIKCFGERSGFRIPDP